MLGAGWLAGLVVVYGRGIKVRKIILNLLLTALSIWQSLARK
jgi:uncharacterized membrane protein YqaE (UPF0057 family)